MEGVCGDFKAICREEGVWSVVDAAHSVGQEVGINLEARLLVLGEYRLSFRYAASLTIAVELS